MNRVSKLHAVYQLRKTRPFQWGAFDCLTWAGDCAYALTGTDPIAWLRGAYSSEREAREIMAKQGWRDMADICRSFYPEIPASQARTGDWVTCRNEDGTDTIGVVIRDKIAAQAQEGVGQVLRARAERAFRVS